ncbi:hypothetical protein TanjilG_31368 [Lupinus angustifolius]|uniref:Serine hydroxymethyltransferase-like domain-containing protein n=1 Tax=Lupinus angustifolius TaxID=3871 RepID=A0A1J7IH31_LUPAN|nr:hypothetical protein TanjilG_31368 [Lupinus angustifolius]
MTGNKVEKLCDLCNITVNKNAVFGDSSALAPGGVRIGLVEKDFEQIGEFLHRAEKHREKKHKKEKKDKEKREGKEKKEKEGRDGKDKEKKDKKEKHRDKKKEKDKHKDKGRDRDKSKISSADEKGFSGQAVDPNAGKLHQNEIKQSDKKGILFEEKLTKQYTGHNGEKARENSHVAEESKDSKFLLELERRIKDNSGGAGNQLVQKFSNTNNHRKVEGTVKLVPKGTWPDSKEKLKDMDLDAKKIDGKEIWAEVRPIGNATVQNHAGNFHPRVDGMPRLVEANFSRTLEATVEGKEKVMEKKDEGKEKKVKEKKDEGKDKVKEKKDDKRRDKKKDKEKEKKGHGKDKDRDKEKKREEKAKERTELKNADQNKLKESNEAGFMGLNSFTQVLKNSHENAVSAENTKKRKDIESNGVPRANDNWPNKIPRPSPSHPFTENGRILEPCQVSIPNASDRLGVTTSVKVDNKESKMNGFVKAPPPFAASSNKAHIATVPTVPVTEPPAKPPHPDAKFLSQVTQVSAKPPHPDTKYLSQVYSVPKMEVWSNIDDQEWLFSNSSSQEKKPAVKSSEVWDTRQVWAETLHIETADVYALPYVVPY